MRELPVGLATDLAVLELTGSTAEEHGDHLLVRTAQNPDFHWGNCLYVLDEDALDDAAGWVRTFQVAFPAATWIAIGLIRMPDDRRAWVAQGLALEQEDVLTTRIPPRQTPLPHGYTVRRLRRGDWAQSLARAVAANDRTGEDEPQSHERFACEQRRAWRALSERDVAAFFGAFVDDALVAELGIVDCSTTARYQSVSTDEDHRRRGLASHLLGVAARWAGKRGCDRWVIVTEATNPAGRVYRRAGFEADTGNASAYRKPTS